MEAKDTVMSMQELDKLSEVNPTLDFSFEDDYPKAARLMREAQAEISLKAGMMKVVEWIRKANHSGDFYYSFDQAELQDQLNEWGIND